MDKLQPQTRSQERDIAIMRSEGYTEEQIARELRVQQQVSKALERKRRTEHLANF